MTKAGVYGPLHRRGIPSHRSNSAVLTDWSIAFARGDLAIETPQPWSHREAEEADRAELSSPKPFDSQNIRKSPLAIVTGASSGIGRCIALRLGDRGYRTILIARRASLLEELANQLRRNRDSTALPMDLADVDAIEPRLTTVLDEQGPVNVVINCAAFGVYAPFEHQRPEVLSRLMRVNHDAPARIIRVALPGLLACAQAGRVAHVMNICSASARMGAWGHAGYAASKGAMRAMTESLMCEFVPRGVRFTVVYPGIIATPYFDQPGMDALWARVRHRAISPERVARAVVSSIGTPRVSLYVPAHYQLLDLIAAISPRLALGIVRRESRPLSSSVPSSAEPLASEVPAEPLSP